MKDWDLILVSRSFKIHIHFYFVGILKKIMTSQKAFVTSYIIANIMPQKQQTLMLLLCDIIVVTSSE